MSVATFEPAVAPRTRLPESFQQWRQSLARHRAFPVVGVAGTRGKSTVIRLLEGIFSAAGLRVATWTDAGVEVRGRRQSSELAAWQTVLRRVAGGGLDIVVQELDWPTVNAVGLPEAAYPVVAITNICANSERCLVQKETRLAIRAYERVRAAGRSDGIMILNGDDFSVAGTEIERDIPAVLVAMNAEAPLVRVHLAEGGRAAWPEKRRLVLGTSSASEVVCAVEELDFALGGVAGFEVQNALLAAATAQACGIPVEVIGPALASFSIPSSMAGSFNLIRYAEGIAVVNRPAPSWFLRPVLRAMRQRPQGGSIAVSGALENVPEDDLIECGRMLGRASDAVILYGDQLHPERLRKIRDGIAQGGRSLVVVHTTTERKAISRGLAMMRPGDGLLVLAENPVAALRQLGRSEGPAPQDEPGEDEIVPVKPPDLEIDRAASVGFAAT